MPLVIPPEAQTYNVSPAAVQLPWAYSPNFYYTNANAYDGGHSGPWNLVSPGLMMIWQFGSAGIPAGWGIYRIRAGHLYGTNGARMGFRLTNAGTLLYQSIAGTFVGWNGSYNEVNGQSDTGMIDVHDSIPVPLASIANLRFEIAPNGGDFSYLNGNGPNIMQVLAGPLPSDDLGMLL